MKRKFLIISAFLAALMLLSACDGNKSPGAGTETVTKEETQNNSGTTPETVPETATVVTEFDGGVKLYSNGVLDFGEIIGDDAGTHMMTMFDRVMADKTLHTNVSQVRIGGVLMDVQWTKPSSDAMESTRLVDLKIEKVTANGHTVKIGVELPMEYVIDLFVADNVIVFQIEEDSWNKCGVSAWVLGKEGVYAHEVGFEDLSNQNYNESIVLFYKGENGHLEYCRTLRKFFGKLGQSEGFFYCVSQKEFASETGSALFEGQTLSMTPMKARIASDLIDLEAYFIRWKKEAYAPYETLEEFLKENAEKYVSGK